MNYNDNELIDYDIDYYSKIPIVDHPNGFFIVNIPNSKIKIDNKTGILNCYKLDIGEYIIPIIYYYNNISTQYNFKLTVKPIFYYNNNIAVVNPLNGIFKSNDNIILANGNINIDLLDVGKKDFIITYTINNIVTETIYKSIIYPKIILEKLEYKFLYNELIKIELKFSHYSGKLSVNNNLFDFSNNFLINKEIINVNIYYLTIKYQLNNILSEENIKVTIYPTIYCNNNKVIVNPIGGVFNILNNNITINDNQILKSSNLLAGNYNIIIEYTINNIKSNYNYNYIVESYFYYEENYKEIIYGMSDISIVPSTNIDNGIFVIDKTELANIDSKSGIITFNDNIAIETYIFKIKLNELECEYKLKILPSFKYDELNYKIIYGQYYESKQAIINCNISDYNFTLINNIKGISINLNNGILYFNKDDIIDIDNYNVMINLNYKDNNINNNINLTIIPDCIYNYTKQIIIYSQNFISEQPKINPSKGIFKISNEFDIDNNGIISIDKIYVGKYNFTIEYIINNISNKINYQINCIPSISYKNYNIEIDYMDNFESDIPIVNPNGGIFKIKDHPFGINIEPNGQLKVNNIYIGNYNFSIIYQINTVFVTNIFNILVKPKIFYNDSIFYYSDFINGIEPTVLTEGGIYETDQENIIINKYNGILFLGKMDPANYSINIKYTINNVSNIAIYNFIIKPNINYNYNTRYKLNQEIFIKSIVNPIGGIFKYENSLFFKENGDFIANNLEIGIYSFDIEYIYNNISSIFNINFIVESNIYYDNKNYIYKENNIIYPNNFNNIGIFIYDITKYQQLGIIDISKYQQLGIIDITNYDVGYYNFNIIYQYKIETIINLQFNIIPVFYYDISNIVLIFGDYSNTNRPIINYLNETSNFTLSYEYDFISINKNNGIINFDNNLKLGNYEIEIVYSVNNISVNTILNIIVLPSIIYDNYNIIIKYNEILKINKPIKKLNFGELIIIDNNNFIINNDGSIKSNNLLDIGIYYFSIKYTIKKEEILYLTDNSEIIKKFNIKVLHDFYYENNKITKIYGTDYESDLPIISHNDGIFSLMVEYNNIKINNKNGKITFLSRLDVDNYNLIILYNLNNITISSYYYYTLIPKIYNQYSSYFNYLSIINIKAPLVKPENGNFLCDQYNINKQTGELILNNLDIGNYNIKILYEYNNQINSIDYNFNVIPIIEYIDLSNIIIYKSNILSVIPNVKPENGIFIGKNINKNGQIIFDNFDIGNHDLNIKYQVNNQISEITVNFEIIPYLFYDITEYEINFGDNCYSNKPIVKPDNFDNFGIIDFSNKSVGIHNIKVNYGKSYQELILKVKPVFYYEEKNIIISYKKIIYPIIVTPGGRFWCNEIIIDENNGIINLDYDNINLKDTEIIIYYELNGVINSENIKINYQPIFNYTIKKIILNYGSVDQSVIPEIKPYGNTIKCNNLLDGIKIDNNGIIYFNNLNIGYYKLNLEYMSIKVDYEIIVNPIFYYEKEEKFYYGFDNYSSMPIIKSNNISKKFKINNNNFIINSLGIIIIKANTSIGIYELIISYETVSTTYKFEILPFIFYENKKIIYGSLYSIKPEINIQEGGIFHIEHNNLVIDNLGEITNINLLEPNKYNILIYYNYNNITYNTYLKLIIKPYINYINELILLPEKGNLNYNDNIINIDEFNNINLRSNSIGKYNLDIEYIYNNIKSKINLEIIASVKNLYKNNEYSLYYDENIKISSLIKKGIFKIENNIDNIIFNLNGDIYINNINVGIYYLNINYNNNNYNIKNIIKIIVKPRITYKTTNIVFGYYKLEPLLVFPLGGQFIFKNKYKNIKYNNGIIIFNNAYPDNYNFKLDYIYNNSIETIKFNINVIPYLSINLNLIKINFNEEIVTNNIIILPNNGELKSNLKDVTISNNIIYIEKDKWIGTYDLNIVYTVNNQSIFNLIKLIIQPIFYYPNNNIILNYYDILTSEKPYNYPFGGTFSLNYDNNIGLIEINSETGIIKFSNIITGDFNIKVIYSLNEFNVETDYYITSNIVFYYNNFLTINYQDNYRISSEPPIYYPKNGKFILNSKDILCDNNGIISFSNLNVGVYNFEINYLINNSIIKSNYKIIINPTINYDNNNLIFEYNTNNIINSPKVNPKNGIFTCYNLPDGFIIDNKTGIIKILMLNQIYKINNLYKINNKISNKGEYILTINYTFNNQIISTNLFININ